MKLFDTQLASNQEWQRAYRAFVRLSIRSLIEAGRCSTELLHVESYAAREGFAVKLNPPKIAFLNIDDPDSGLNNFIRQAVAAGYLSGQEAWLQHAKWHKGGHRP